MRLFPFILLFCLTLNAETIRIAQWGDIHAFRNYSGNGTNHTQATEWCKTNDVDILLWTGDCYEQDTNFNTASITNWAWTVSDVTNAAAEMVAAGIMVLPCDGNHDADDTTSTSAMGGLYAGCWPVESEAWKWTNFFPLSFYSSQAGYATGYLNGSVMQVAMTYTNGPVKLLLVNYDSSIAGGPDAASEVLPQTQWITNLAGIYSDHNLIVYSHFMVSMRGQQPTGTIVREAYWPKLSRHDLSGGPTRYYWHGVGDLPWENGLQNSVNPPVLCLSGHTRSLLKGHVGVRASDGMIIDVTCFNQQEAGYYQGGTTYISPNGTLINVCDIDTLRRTITTYTVDIYTQDHLTNWTTNLYNTASTPHIHYMHEWGSPLRHPAPKGRFARR